MAIDTGGPAFAMRGPINYETDGQMLHMEFAQPGMTLLDWFAGQATMGIMTADSECLMAPSAIAQVAWETAAAMLTEKRRREADNE